jgi:hypothetical protein
MKRDGVAAHLGVCGVFRRKGPPPNNMVYQRARFLGQARERYALFKLLDPQREGESAD